MNCPFCGESISAGATKCKNCSEYIGLDLNYDDNVKLRAHEKLDRNHVIEKRELTMGEAKKPFHKHATSFVSPKNKSIYSWIWNVGAVLALAGVIVGLYLLNKQV